MDARVFAQWTLRAGLALFAIVAGLYLSPWLGGGSLILAGLFWLAVIAGVLYAGEGMPWIDSIDSVSRILRFYAPPLTGDEKQQLEQRAREREQVLLWEDDQQNQRIAREQGERNFFNSPPPDNFNTPSLEAPKSVRQTAATREEPRTLDELVGLASVKETILEYKTFIEISKRRGQDPRKELQPNFVMLGNPGTGKTTVAKIMGRIFCEIGYLPTDKIVIAERGTLVGEYTGQTAPKTRKVLESALGGTLFIDEAYSLAKEGDTFGEEAIETLLLFMSENVGKLVVIVAGYEQEMTGFLASNQGLNSRFTNYIHFPDYTPDECTQLFKDLVAEQKLKLTPEVAAILPDLFSKLCAAPHWSNGRDVRTFREFTLRAQAKRLKANGEQDLYAITNQDLESALEAALQNKSHGRK